MCRTRQKQQTEILSSGPTTSQRIKRGQNLINKVISPNKLSKDSSYNLGDHIQTKNPTYNCHRDHRQLKIPHTIQINTQKLNPQQHNQNEVNEVMNYSIKLTIFRHFIGVSPFSNHFYLSINEVTNAATPDHQIENGDTPDHPN